MKRWEHEHTSMQPSFIIASISCKQNHNEFPNEWIGSNFRWSARPFEIIEIICWHFWRKLTSHSRNETPEERDNNN